MMRLRMIILMVAMGGILVLAIGHDINFAWFMAGCLGVIIAHVVLVFTMKRAFTANIHFQQMVYTAGDQVFVTMHLARRSRLPICWLVIEQYWHNETTEQHCMYRQLVIPLFRRTISYKYCIRNVQRGIYRTKGVQLTTGDIFGLFNKVLRVEADSLFLVCPRTQHMILPFKDFLTKQSDAHYSRQQTATFNSIRDYVNGDPLNRIHWKSTARTNALKIKENERSGSRQLVVLLDGSQSSESEEQTNTLFETCMQVAVSVTEYAVRLGNAVQFKCSNKDQIELNIRSGIYWEQALTSLSTVRADGVLPFHNIVRLAQARVAEGTMIICVTTSLTDQLCEALAAIRSQHRRCGLLFVYKSAQLSWHQLQMKQRLQAIGCLFYSMSHMSHTQMNGTVNEVISDVS